VASTSTTKLELFKPTPGTAEPFRASDFNDNMDKIDAEAVAIDGRLDAVEADITTAQGDITGLDSQVSSLDGRLDTAESTITSLDGRLDTAESEIDALQAGLPAAATVITVSGTTRALLNTDANNFIRFTSADAVTFTIDDTFSAAQYVNCVQDGAGKISFIAGTGVTLQSPSGATVRTSAQYAWASVIKIAAGEYRIVGNIEVIA
jgi:uncharacterized phage infection (PIP) family protein YhgE